MTAETRKGNSRAPPRPALSAVGDLVRRHDRDRYQTALFAPAGPREALFALYAFHYEIARVRESVSQPMLGQIRLQWWREVIEAAFAGTAPRSHEVAEPLTATIREYRLDRGALDRLIDTRERDLTDEPPATMAALEDYAEGTSATLIRLALQVLDAADDRARAAGREVGIGYALAGLLRAMPFHARAGRSYIPADVAELGGFDPEGYRNLRDSSGLRSVAKAVAERAAEHLAAARAHRAEIPRQALAALLPAVIADRFLTRLRRAGYNPFAPKLALPDSLQSWRLFAAALHGRF